MVTQALAQQTEEEQAESRREVERQLERYRSKMTADQFAALEKQFRERMVLARTGLPRLSLFYFDSRA